MSVSLVSEPLEAIPAGNCAIYGLQLSGGGSSPEVKSIGYLLFSGAGIQLNPLEQIPWTGSAERFNAAQDIKRKLLETTLLGYGVTAVTQDDSAVSGFYITYGEITYNGDTCEQTQDISTISDTRYALNATFPWYIDPTILDSGSLVVLTERPSQVCVYKGQQDWLHIWRKSGPIGVSVKGYDADGNLILDIVNNRSVNKEVFIYPIGPGNAFFGWNDSIAYYDVTVHDSTLDTPGGTALEASIQAVVWSCRFTLKSCDITPPNNEIYFREPMGGYSGFRFLNVQAGTSTSSKRYRKGKPCSTAFPGLGQDYGATRYDVESFPGYNMRTEIEYVEGIERWLEAFFAAENHFQKFQMPDGSYQYQKVNLVDGAYSTLNNRNTILLEASFEAHMSKI